MGNIVSNIKHDVTNSKNSLNNMNIYVHNIEDQLREATTSLNSELTKNSDLQLQLKALQQNSLEKDDIINKLNTQIQLKQKGNFNLVQKNQELHKLNDNFLHIFEKSDDDLVDAIITSSSKEHDNDWFYNLLFERKNYLNAINHFRSEIAFVQQKK